jgi:phosphatidylglycerophosphate synthase
MGLFQEYKSSLKLIEVEEVFDLIFYRPLAFLFVKLIYGTNITPNQITILSLSFGIAGGIALSFGTVQSILLAAFLFITFNVLDCSDGQLARLKGNGTEFGRILDGMADYMVSTSAYLGIGFGFANHSSNPLLYWLLILVTAASNIMHAVLVDFYRNRFIDYTQDRISVLDDGLEKFKKEYEGLKKQKGNIFKKFIIGAYIKYSSMQNSMASNEEKEFKISAPVYYKYNKTLIHFWTYLGPTTQWTFLIICALINRLDIYLWGLIVVFNTYAIIIYVAQKRVDKKLKTI